MPGFMQFITAIILWAYITMYDVTPPNALYMAAVAFTAYGVHWFALGLNKYSSIFLSLYPAYLLFFMK
jgi:hypothetical protein